MKKKINMSNAQSMVAYIFPKDVYELGPEHIETELGYPEGALRQFRGPNCEHILEYEDYYKGHLDGADPNKDPIGHLVVDAPETIITGGFALIGAISISSLYSNWKSRRKIDDKKMLWIVAIIVLVIAICIGIFFAIKWHRESKWRTVYR